MDKKKSQLNIQIDPNLLISLKSEAVKNGKTLSAFVTERLSQSGLEVKDDNLESRLIKIEKQLDSLKNLTLAMDAKTKQSTSIFSDIGAKKYGEIAREMFELHRKELRLSFNDAFEELSKHLGNYDSQPSLVFELLTGNHKLTGLEMTEAYRNGSCGMRSALSDWIKSPLEPLNEAFLNAVEIGNLG